MHVVVHECVYAYIIKRITLRGCDPPPQKKTTKQNPNPNPTTESFFKDVNECEFEVQHKVDDIAGGKEINNKQVQPEYQKWLSGNSVVCFKVPEVPVNLEENKWNYPFTWFFSADPKWLHPALAPQAKPEDVKTEEEDVPRLMTRRFSSRKAEKDPFVLEEAE